MRQVSLILLFFISSIVLTFGQEIELKGVVLGGKVIEELKSTTLEGIEGSIKTAKLKDGTICVINFLPIKDITYHDAKKLIKALEIKYGIKMNKCTVKEFLDGLGMYSNYTEDVIKGMSKQSFMYLALKDGIAFYAIANKLDRKSLNEFNLTILDKELHEIWLNEE